MRFLKLHFTDDAGKPPFFVRWDFIALVHASHNNETLIYIHDGGRMTCKESVNEVMERLALAEANYGKHS